MMKFLIDAIVFEQQQLHYVINLA